MYRFECFENHTSRAKNKASLGIDGGLFHQWMAQQPTKPNKWIGPSENDTIGTAAPVHHDPILLIVNVEEDDDDDGYSVVHHHPSQDDLSRERTNRVTRKVKVRSSECLVLPTGRYHYSLLALRRRLALGTGQPVDTDYGVVSSKSEHVIDLPPSNSNHNILDLFGSRLQLRFKHSRPRTSTSVVLQIKGRHFDFDGTLTVADTTLRFVESTTQPYQGTSYNVWDGSLLMARYLEQNPQIVFGRSVTELGSGCGAAGMAAAALGACSVTLTDLPGPVLEHLQANIECNDEAFIECRVEARACDWRDPPMELLAVRKSDVILVADCVWVEELVDPLFDVLDVVTRPASDQPKKADKGKEEATESTVMMYDEDVKESAIRIQEIGKSTRDERSSSTLDQSTHYKFERGCLERSDAMGLHSTPSVDFEECASFYDEDDHTTTRVIISYQRRGKSTHDLFIQRLHDLFASIEVVSIPGQPEIFTIYSCQR